MTIDLDLRPDSPDNSLFIDHHGRPDDPHAFAPIEVLLFPDAIKLGNFSLFITEQGEGQVMFGDKLVVGLQGIGANPPDSCSRCGKFGLQVAETDRTLW